MNGFHRGPLELAASTVQGCRVAGIGGHVARQSLVEGRLHSSEARLVQDYNFDNLLTLYKGPR